MLKKSIREQQRQKMDIGKAKLNYLHVHLHVMSKINSKNLEEEMIMCGHADSVVCETEDGMIAAYPTGEERKRFFILFDQLFIELKQLGYLHEPIDEYEFNNSHSQFKDLASKNNINLDNATQLTFADFGI